MMEWARGERRRSERKVRRHKKVWMMRMVSSCLAACLAHDYLRAGKVIVRRDVETFGLSALNVTQA
jgi:hypothetical protein